MKPTMTAALLAAGLFFSGPAQASELFGGFYVHDVKTPLDKSGVENGVDLLAGLRGGGIGRTPLQPYGFIAINSAGKTSYGAVGLSARFGGRVYVRPGLGLALHTGSTGDYQIDGNRKIEFGSRLLFEPEFAVGLDIAPRVALEASWIHMSHGTLFGRQNPGIDNIGARVNVRF